MKNKICLGLISGLVFTLLSSLEMLIPSSNEWYAKVFPDMTTLGGFVAFLSSLFFVGMFMGVIYTKINSGIPGKGLTKGINYGFMIWLVGGTMWPIMVMGFGPVSIWLSDLFWGLVVFVLTGITIVKLYGK